MKMRRTYDRKTIPQGSSFARDRYITRSEFLRIITVSGLGACCSIGSGQVHTSNHVFAGAENELIEKVFEESLIIDGNVNLGINRGQATISMEPGAIKRGTGINVGGHTTRVETLDNRNLWVAARNGGLLRIDRARDIEKARAENR